MTEPTQQRTSQPSRPNNQSRNPKSKNGRPQFGKGKSRYGQKKNRRPAVAPKPRRGPEKEYISACCSLPARKPRCGQLEAVVNPETKKSKDVPKGLGHWRCSGCGKPTKVTPRKPQVAEPTPAPEATIA